MQSGTSKTKPRKCIQCKRNLSKGRLQANKRLCGWCEQTNRTARRRRAHDKRIESEDFTSDDYWFLYKMQGGKCCIHNCRATGKSKHLTVEHDHKCSRNHDPRKWCRACVRGLTCAMHNEWIGRAGDDPEVFESIASYLLEPPAREALMYSEVVFKGPGYDVATFLVTEYSMSVKRAQRILEQARGVGQVPRQVKGATIIVRYLREPRNQTGLFEVTESDPRFAQDVALKLLMDEYGISERRSKSALNKAWENGKARMTTPTGVVRILYHGRGKDQSYTYSIERTDA